MSDGTEFIELDRDRNPDLKIILTVSPVPLIATASSDHVLTTTTYSKSILRAVAGKLTSLYDNVVYFPSFEIIAGAFDRGAYFENDLRSVTEQGINSCYEVIFQKFRWRKLQSDYK